MKSFLQYSLEKDTVKRSTKIALVVGTILALLNHYHEIIDLDVSLTAALQMLLTYLVPYSVATYGQVSGKRQRELLPMQTGQQATDQKGPGIQEAG